MPSPKRGRDGTDSPQIPQQKQITKWQSGVMGQTPATRLFVCCGMRTMSDSANCRPIYEYSCAFGHDPLGTYYKPMRIHDKIRVCNFLYSKQ